MTVNLEATDAISGVSKYYYSKDGGKTYVVSTNPNYTFTSLEASDYIVMVYVEDKAGNTSPNQEEITTVREYSWCERNNITNLGDCAIATAANNSNIDEAKAKIEQKGTPDFAQTSPTYTYEEKHLSTLSTTTTYNLQIAYSNSYTFDETTGKYTLVNSQVVDIESIDLNDGKEYFSLLSKGINDYTIFKLKSISKQITDGEISYKVEKYDYTYNVKTYDPTGVGMYAADDDIGTSYYYRGSVGGNFVKFAEMYWRIIRINGDGSIRLIYFSDKDTKQGKNAFNSSINIDNWDPTFEGLMYNDDEISPIETIGKIRNFDRFSSSTVYYFGKGYEWDQTSKRFKLIGSEEDGSILNGKWKDIYSQLLPQNSEYYYTCFGTSAEETCPVIKKVNGYVNNNTASVQYISHNSTSYENATKNIKKSQLLNVLEPWYEEKFINKKDSNNKSYDKYIANSIFCNDRSFSPTTNGDGFSVDKGTNYGPYYRIFDNRTPTYQCPYLERDGFTISNATVGNKLLKYPIGIMTLDELSFAGGVSGKVNLLYYMNYNDGQYSYVWTMSPTYYNDYYHSAGISYLYASGYFNSWVWPSEVRGIRPVISLSKDVLISRGDGTASNPYEVALQD